MTLRLLLSACLLLLSCSQHQAMPTVDLQQIGWQVWTGQALWQPPGKKPRIAGDILISLHENGDRYIEFVKGPVAVFNAQTHADRWSLTFIDRDGAYTGSGKPPKRFIWFYLPEVINQKQQNPLQYWQVDYTSANSIELINSTSGEAITLVLDHAL